MWEPEKLPLAKCGKNKGFLLLEVLISIVIIATTLVVINRAFSTSLRAVGLAGDYLLADCVLEDKIFDIQINDSFSDIRLSDTVELAQQEFFYSMEISQADITVDEDEEFPLKQANLSVNWGELDSVSRLNVSTYVWEEEK